MVICYQRTVIRNILHNLPISDVICNQHAVIRNILHNLTISRLSVICMPSSVMYVASCPCTFRHLEILHTYPGTPTNAPGQNVQIQNDPIQNAPATVQTSQASKHPKQKTPQDFKRPKPQTVPTTITKRPSLKTSPIQNVPSFKTSLIPWIRNNFFQTQNAPSLKPFQLQLQNVPASKHPQSKMSQASFMPWIRK
jgi:hypothetical protein